MRRLLTTITEIAMILYWILAGALTLGLLSIDPSLMYSNHNDPVIVAWNWSFFPIDIAFAVIGLAARYGAVFGDRRAQFATVAATLMFCAGLMAVSFWAMTGDFSPLWWGVNLWLMLLGAANLAVGEAASKRATRSA